MNLRPPLASRPRGLERLEREFYNGGFNGLEDKLQRVWKALKALSGDQIGVGGMVGRDYEAHFLCSGCGGGDLWWLWTMFWLLGWGRKEIGRRGRFPIYLALKRPSTR